VSSEVGTARLEILVGCREGGVQLFLLLVRRSALIVHVIVVHQIVRQTTTTAAASGRPLGDDAPAAAVHSHRFC